MKILVLPGIFRRMTATVCIWAPIFFLVLISTSQMVINDTWYYRLPIRAVVAVFMAMHFWWFMAANEQDLKRDRFLVSLPLSRRQVARLSLNIMLISQLIVITAIAVVCLGLLAFRLINLDQLLFITIYCLWFPLFTLFTYCLVSYIKHTLIRLLVFALSMTLPMGILFDLSSEPMHGGELTAVLVVPVIFSIIILLIIRHSERRFLQMDLL